MTSEKSKSSRLKASRNSSLPLKVPRSLATAGLILLGIRLSDAFHWSAFFSMFFAFVCLTLAVTTGQRHMRRTEMAALAMGLIGLGASLWTVRHTLDDRRDIGQLVTEKHLTSETVVRIIGKVSNIPSLDTFSDSASRGSSQQPPRTLFLMQARSLVLDNKEIAVRGLCRILVNGDATLHLRWGDRIELTGQIDQAQPPANPGEFDYARHLERSGISAMMFVKHPAAARILESRWWHPGSLLTDFRQHTVSLLKSQLSSRNRATAEALLLGNRGHLTPDLERDFVASGTMHLLAISGLHVGILYVFLVRVLNVLLLPRNRSLIIAGMVCVLYCFLTDLRPSVMRATVFIVLHILGQLMCRDMRMGSLIGTTSLLLMLFDPSIAFDVGAWLSFLAVGALGWVSDRSGAVTERPVPLDTVSWQDRIRDLRLWAGEWLGLSYRQMLAVTMLSSPLVATQFHMVSLTGMVINVLLIPFTTLTLICGFIFIAAGLILPPLAVVSGAVFGSLLWLLNAAVAFSADVRFGFITIPDLPGWFLPLYYILLAGMAVSVQSLRRQIFRLALLLLVTAMLWQVTRVPRSAHLLCTVLSVGHGNAVVVETPEGKVLLFDAGALNRGERTADLISRFLWTRGYRMIDGIVISHADMDHYNSVASLLDRVPAGQLLISQEFARSDSPDVQDVLDTAADLSIPCHILMDGDQIVINGVTIDFLQASLSASDDNSDNASSLVALLKYGGQTICLPGDLEDEGQKQLLERLPQCDFLVSPHHGSLAANPPELAAQLRPKHVIVSARDDRLQQKLQAVYSESTLRMTSIHGAVSYQILPDGASDISGFHDQKR